MVFEAQGAQLSRQAVALGQLMAQFTIEALDKTSAVIGGNLHAALVNNGITTREHIQNGAIATRKKTN